MQNHRKYSEFCACTPGIANAGGAEVLRRFQLYLALFCGQPRSETDFDPPGDAGDYEIEDGYSSVAEDDEDNVTPRKRQKTGLLNLVPEGQEYPDINSLLKSAVKAGVRR